MSRNDSKDEKPALQGPIGGIQKLGLESTTSSEEDENAMSLAELTQNVLTLSEKEQNEFLVWVNRLEADHGDVPGEALDQLAAEIWDQDDRHAPPAHSGR